MSLLAVSIATFVLLYGILFAVVAWIVITSGSSMLVALGLSVLVLAVQFLISPWITDLQMRLFYRMRFKDTVLPEYLEDFIGRMCEANGMKYPKVGIIEDGSPNAFTYGHTKNNARIVLTRGLLDMLDEDEVRGVTAHEIGHAVHYDMLLMTAAQIVPMFLYTIYDTLIKYVKSSKRDKDSSKGKAGAAVAAIAIYILYVISEYIILWFSRTREYYADDFAARSTRNPNALASALVQVGFGLSVASTERQSKHSAASTNALGIADGKAGRGMALSCMDGDQPDKNRVRKAMCWDMWNIWAKFYELKSTHPLTSKRILRLSRLSPEFGQPPYITFDEERPESFVDDFLRELFIKIMPWLGGLLCFFIGLFAAPNASFLPLTFAIFAALSLLKLGYTHPVRREWKECTVEDLLGEVKVSGVRPVPCKLRGRVIGRGDPGCIFNEDFVLQDETGIMFLNYNRPFTVQDKFFALFRAADYIGSEIEITGWYRRAPSPYVDMRFMSRGDVVKRCDSTRLGRILRWTLLVISVLLTVFFWFYS